FPLFANERRQEGEPCMVARLEDFKANFDVFTSGSLRFLDWANVVVAGVTRAVPFDTTCIRKKHVITIYSQYPFRPIQVILRLYQSPAEVLTGFDVDCPCFAFNGCDIFANPRAIVALMRQCNIVDISRRSPSYEMRLAKYAKRGFEILVPALEREAV
ncbi:hypothetical protein BDZ97DRAFT_1594843, partial [Flammula alnicola]